MGRLAKDTKAKKRFFSFFGSFSRRKNLNSKPGKDPGTQDKGSTMILKLKSPGAAGEEVEDPNGQLLSDILTNEKLFDKFYGRSLVLQADMTVEKRKDDGTPKTMTMSGVVPVTLSRGERDGKPTRELRVRGHLRRKRSGETRLPYDDSALKTAGFGKGSRRKEIQFERRPKPPEESKLLQRNSKLYERYRTLSTVSTRSKKDNVWPQTDAEGVESGEEDLEPSRIENWSPLFDFSSPMSGPTGRDRVRALSDWTTPTPRFDLNVMKDEDAEERSKDKMQDIENQKKSRFNLPPQVICKPKDDLKIVDRTLVIGKTDSSDQDESDKCTAKTCKDKDRTTREAGIQTADPHNGKEAKRVHSSTQTDLVSGEPTLSTLSRTEKRLLSPEEIHQKLAKGFNESKHMISSIHEKAANKFAEVHGKIQDAIHKRAGEIYAEYPDSNGPSHTYGHGQCHIDEHHKRYAQQAKLHRDDPRGRAEKDQLQHAELGHNKQHHETGRLDGKENEYQRGCNQQYAPGYGHPVHKTGVPDDKKKDDSPHKAESNISRSSRDDFHPRETVKDLKRDIVGGISPSRDHEREGNKKHHGAHIHAQDGHVHNKQPDLQNLRYNTSRGYYYEEDPRGKDMNVNTPAYPSDTEEARQSNRRKSQYPSTFQGEERLSPAKQSSSSKNEDGEKPKSPSPTSGGRRSDGSKKSRETIRSNIIDTKGNIEAKKMNPITTITVSRSHTRFYNYSDGYTYTERVGRQTVVIEAPKGMYFAS